MEAMRTLEEDSSFDLVIIDMQMPEMTGLEVGKLIIERSPDLPIVLLSPIGDESRRNYGQIFSSILTKPVKHLQLLEAIQTHLSETKAAEQKWEKERPALLSDDFASKHPLRILVVEDNIVNQKLILKILSKLGYTPALANHGKEALQLLKEAEFEVVLMDIQMPELDGLETTRMIRKSHHHQPFIIAMTANALPEDREACAEAGMNDYVSKPVHLATLLGVLESAALQIEDVG
jgi:CheY-like chemotaxis protein